MLLFTTVVSSINANTNNTNKKKKSESSLGYALGIDYKTVFLTLLREAVQAPSMQVFRTT